MYLSNGPSTLESSSTTSPSLSELLRSIEKDSKPNLDSNRSLTDVAQMAR